MFSGTIPTELRSVFVEHARAWPDNAHVHIGCSGNMTIERTLHATCADKGFTFHGNDVNPYSCALGWFYSGQPVPHTLKEESAAELGWLEPYLDNGASTLATLLLGTRFLQFVGKPGAYHRRMVRAYRDQWPEVHARTLAKVEAVTVRLASFFAGDMRKMIAAVDDPDEPVVTFPPFYGSYDYMTMFKGIDEHFDWPEPEFENIDEDSKDEIIELVTDRRHWAIGLHVERPELPLRAIVQTTNRNVPIYFYSSHGPQRLVRPQQSAALVAMPKIGPDEDIAGPLKLHPLKPPQFSALRSMFLNKRIKPGAPDVCFGVSAGGRFIGAYGLSRSKFDGSAVYLMSDFPVGWSKYQRLSKLIVLAALSRESKLMAQHAIPRRLVSVATTAFSDHPNSSKYGRGVPGLKLIKRTEPAPDGEHRFQLQYQGPLGAWTLDEALELWQAKHSQLRATHPQPAAAPAGPVDAVVDGPAEKAAAS